MWHYEYNNLFFIWLNINVCFLIIYTYSSAAQVTFNSFTMCTQCSFQIQAHYMILAAVFTFVKQSPQIKGVSMLLMLVQAGESSGLENTNPLWQTKWSASVTCKFIYYSVSSPKVYLSLIICQWPLCSVVTKPVVVCLRDVTLFCSIRETFHAIKGHT